MKILQYSVMLVLVSTLIACSNSDMTATDQENIGNLRLAILTSTTNDGSTTRITSSYNASGQLIEQNFFSNGATAAYLNSQYTYDIAGQLDTRANDDDLNGSTDRFYQYYYSDAGQLLRREQDVGNDGSVDFNRSYTVDSENQLTAFTTSRLNADGSSTVVSTGSFVYVSGARTTFEIDNEPLGDVDYLSEFQYRANGSVSKAIITTQQAGSSGEGVYTYESGICDRASMIAGFTHFCITVPQ